MGVLDGLVWTLRATVAVWIVAEIVLQFRQYRMGGKATVSEWRSLAVILLAVVVGQYLAITAARLTSMDIPLDATTGMLVGLPVAWAGIGFRLWSIHTLGRFFRGVVHVQADHEVIDTGPYRVLRHPSYAGALLAVLGFAVTTLNGAAILVLMVCGVLAVGYRIRVEERVLRTELGQPYRDYCARTCRLVPLVW